MPDKEEQPNEQPSQTPHRYQREHLHEQADPRRNHETLAPPSYYNPETPVKPPKPPKQ
jgi:hypothetical protein